MYMIVTASFWSLIEGSVVDVTAEAAEVADFVGDIGYLVDTFAFLAEDGDTAGETARFLGGLATSL